MKRRGLALFLTAAMLATSMPVGSFASDMDLVEWDSYGEEVGAFAASDEEPDAWQDDQTGVGEVLTEPETSVPAEGNEGNILDSSDQDDAGYVADSGDEWDESFTEILSVEDENPSDLSVLMPEENSSDIVLVVNDENEGSLEDGIENPDQGESLPSGEETEDDIPVPVIAAEESVDLTVPVEVDFTEIDGQEGTEPAATEGTDEGLTVVDILDPEDSLDFGAENIPTEPDAVVFSEISADPDTENADVVDFTQPEMGMLSVNANALSVSGIEDVVSLDEVDETESVTVTFDANGHGYYVENGEMVSTTTALMGWNTTCWGWDSRAYVYPYLPYELAGYSRNPEATVPDEEIRFTEDCTVYAVWNTLPVTEVSLGEEVTVSEDTDVSKVFSFVPDESGFYSIIRYNTAYFDRYYHHVENQGALSHFYYMGETEDGSRYDFGEKLEANTCYYFDVHGLDDVNYSFILRKMSEPVVTFDPNGGIFDDPEAAEKVYRSDSNLNWMLPGEEKLHLDGYKLVGWSTERNGEPLNYDELEGLPITENKTLYAVWREYVTVTFHSGGEGYRLLYKEIDGEWTEYRETDSFSEWYYKGDSVCVNDIWQTDNPNKILIGWYSDRETRELLPYDERNGHGWLRLDKDTDLYAVWDEQRDVSVTLNAGDRGYFTDGNGDEKKEYYLDLQVGNWETPQNYLYDYHLESEDGKLQTGWNTLSDGTGIHYALWDSVFIYEGLTLYAEWTETISVTYDANGHGYYWNDFGQKVSSITATAGKNCSINQYWMSVYPNLPYKLLGYSLDDKATVADEELLLKQDCTVYAVWEEEQTITPLTLGEEVTVSGAPGDFRMYSFTPETSDFYKIYSDDYVCARYDINWVDVENGTRNDTAERLKAGTCYYFEIYGDSDEYSFTLDRVEEPVLTFDPNGGKFGDSQYAECIVRSDSRISDMTPGEVYRENYRLVGWSEERDGDPLDYEELYDLSVTDNKTLYAVWTPIVYLTFDANGHGYYWNDYEGKVNQIREWIDKDNTIDWFSWTPERNPDSNKVFVGYALDPTAEEPLEYDENISGYLIANQDITLYAVWKDGIKVTFDANGGGNFYYDEGRQKQVNCYLPGSVFWGYELNWETGFTPADGKQLKGWSLSKDGEVLGDEELTIDTEITLYAIVKDTLTLTFHGNGGQVYRSRKKKPETVKETILKDDTFGEVYRYGVHKRPGYNFLGWSLDGSNLLDDDYRFEEDTTLYAVWEEDWNDPEPVYTLTEGKATKLNLEAYRYTAIEFTPGTTAEYRFKVDGGTFRYFRVFDANGAELAVTAPDTTQYVLEKLNAGERYIIGVLSLEEGERTLTATAKKTATSVEVRSSRQSITTLDKLSSSDLSASVTYTDGSKEELKGDAADSLGNVFRYAVREEKASDTQDVTSAGISLKKGTYLIQAVQRTGSAILAELLTSANEVKLQVTCNHEKKTDWVVRLNATCTTPGNKVRTCMICGEEEEAVIPATGHKEVKDAAVAASCETAGKTEGSHCSVCGKVMKEQKVIPATGHKEVKDAGVAASCETAGKTEGSHCSVCGKVLKEQKVIPATGHTEVKDPGVAASCETPGKTEGSHCSVCGKVLKEQTEIPATGHQWGNWVTTTAGNGKKQEIQTRTCTLCGEKETRTFTNSTPLEGDKKDKSTPAGKEKEIVATKGDASPKNAVYETIALKSTKQTKNSITLSWTKVSGASGYYVYGAKRSGKLARIGSTTKTSFVHKSLSANTFYKYVVMAYKVTEEEAKVVSTSTSILVSTVSAKTANPTAVKVAPSKNVTVKKKTVTVNLKKGGSTTLKTSVVYPSNKKGVKSVRKVAYESSDKKIATVSAKGVVKAKKKGTCYIYAYTQNGVTEKIKVVVK